MIKRVHFLGIGGSGASAAAAIAQHQGYEVTGCDLEPHNEFTAPFRKSQLFKGHDPAHLQGVLNRHLGKIDARTIDILACTPAIFSYDPQNPELIEAKKKGIEILTWQQFLGKYLTKDKFVIAVCGTHGKTTTTAMIAKILEDAGLDPTALLGAIVPKWGTNFRVPSHRHPERAKRVEGSPQKRGYFVVEADEYNDNFLSYTPDINVVTNIEMDHPEYFKDFEAVKRSFKKFLSSTKQTIIANLKDPGVRDVIASVAKQSSLDENPNEIAASPAAPRNDGLEMIDYSKNLIDFPLQIPGQFNRWNASAAYQVGLALGLKPPTIKQSLGNYFGIGRRFEYIGKYKGAEIYSDFGHHPTEIKTTMQAAREKFPNKRIILVYQPHMFTRTKALFDDFVKVFRQISASPASGVDKTFIIDIYPSREVDNGLVSSKQLVDAVHVNTVAYYSKDKILDKLKKETKSGDILFFMSAGDTDYLAKKLVKV